MNPAPADPAAAWRAAHETVAAVDLERDVVVVSGPDAAAYLHGQLSQRIEGLALGATVGSFLLAPNGKVEAVLRLTRVADDRFVVDTDAGRGGEVAASLDRFKLRSAVEIEVVAWTAVGLRGPDAADVVASAPLDLPVTLGRDLLGPDPRIPDWVPRLDRGAAEALRIEAGRFRTGSDITPSTIPQETGWEQSLVDFDKGCYRGQELVERIHSRGGVRRRLEVLELAGAAPSAGAVVMAGGADGGAEVGRLTSVATVPGEERALAVALLRLDRPAADDDLTVDGRAATVRERDGEGSDTFP